MVRKERGGRGEDKRWRLEDVGEGELVKRFGWVEGEEGVEGVECRGRGDKCKRGIGWSVWGGWEIGCLRIWSVGC
jgi:hypothetical protein